MRIRAIPWYFTWLVKVVNNTYTLLARAMRIFHMFTVDLSAAMLLRTRGQRRVSCLMTCKSFRGSHLHLQSCGLRMERACSTDKEVRLLAALAQRACTLSTKDNLNFSKMSFLDLDGFQACRHVRLIDEVELADLPYLQTESVTVIKYSGETCASW